jgi:hypothetical protein
MKPLTRLIHDLGEDPELEQAYRLDPVAVARRYELNEEETHALLSGDIEQVRKACGLDNIHLTNGTIKPHEG